MELIVGMTSNISYKNLRAYLGLDKQKLTPIQDTLINSISTLMTAKGIDAETAIAIFQSFENKIGNSLSDNNNTETIIDRLMRFNSFLSFIEHKSDLMATIKDFGLMSKAELEQTAIETGNWIPFMKRVEKDKLAEEAGESEEEKPNESNISNISHESHIK